MIRDSERYGRLRRVVIAVQMVSNSAGCTVDRSVANVW